MKKSTIAAVRFGAGFRPFFDPPRGAEDLLASLEAPDRMAEVFPVTPFLERLTVAQDFFDMRRALRKSDTAEARKAIRVHRNRQAAIGIREQAHLMARSVYAPVGFRERLVSFWADHFTTVNRHPAIPGAVSTFIDEAIRPHVTARFSDMLQAVALHPVMVVYLDQGKSIGPNSNWGKERGRGLNENYARELIELHTLGVGGTYTQDDVRNLAYLLTGIYFHRKRGTLFHPKFAEPGVIRVLGKDYGRGKIAKLDHIKRAIDDLAVHPDTARHIARKMAVHFVSDTPEAGLVDAMTEAFRRTDGDLMAVVGAMLDHPASWQNFGAKARQPYDFVTASVRALGMGEKAFVRATPRAQRQFFIDPMAGMGQPYQKSPGPDGWPEAVEDWITPQGLAARIQWAMTVPKAAKMRLPDPREFVATALQDAAGERLQWAAKRAETRWEGVGLVLSSPEFNRR